MAVKALGNMIVSVLLSCCFGPFFGHSWPLDPLKRVRLKNGAEGTLNKNPEVTAPNERHKERAHKHIKAGCLKAVWPDLLGAFLRSGQPRRARESLQKCGGFAPHIFEGQPRAPGLARMVFKS